MAQPKAVASTVDALRSEVERLHVRNEALQSDLYDLKAAHRVLQGEDESYSALVRRVRETVREVVPADETVLVVGRGDPAFVDLYGREAWHFPRTDDGRYAGYYPKRGISAVAHLEALRARGACYFLIPAVSRWWLDYYPELLRHLDRRYLRVADVPDTCVLYSLRDAADLAGHPAAWLEALLDDHLPTFGEDPSILDWETGLDLAAVLPRRTVFSPLGDESRLPYLDATVDLVVISTEDEKVANEAERVAAKAVVNLAGRPRGRKPATRYLRWKATPEAVRTPSVSIIIPCHDGLRYTTACLSSLRETLPPWFRGEIVVVDDASSDGTNDHLERLCRVDRRLRLLSSESNQGFLASCNVGARAAKSDLLLFLNNDTVLLPGWLPPLVRTFADFPDVGAVGGKLLFEDGTLQEAGALVFADASAAKIGYLDPDVETPLYEYVREVDYVSAAFLMTPLRLFRELGGLDSRYGFGYYDDDDYCFAVRAAGRRVYYQPESVIVHVEGASAGTDLASGLKQHQVMNQAVFAEKWRDVLERKPTRPEPLDWYAMRRLATTRKTSDGANR
jgi:GT2 family glycosyltransferase